MGRVNHAFILVWVFLEKEVFGRCLQEGRPQEQCEVTPHLQGREKMTRLGAGSHPVSGQPGFNWSSKVRDREAHTPPSHPAPRELGSLSLCSGSTLESALGGWGTVYLHRTLKQLQLGDHIASPLSLLQTSDMPALVTSFRARELNSLHSRTTCRASHRWYLCLEHPSQRV